MQSNCHRLTTAYSKTHHIPTYFGPDWSIIRDYKRRRSSLTTLKITNSFYTYTIRPTLSNCFMQRLMYSLILDQ
jgi:hypothetical protein